MNSFTPTSPKPKETDLRERACMGEAIERAELLHKLKKFQGNAPQGYKFDREEAYDHVFDRT